MMELSAEDVTGDGQSCLPTSKKSEVMKCLRLLEEDRLLSTLLDENKRSGKYSTSTFNFQVIFFVTIVLSTNYSPIIFAFLF